MFAAIDNILIYMGAAVVCIIAAAICEAIMDTLQFHYHRSKFNRFRNVAFWDPTISWKNKYRDGDPTKGRRFPGSITIFVGFTDAWHAFKLLRNLFAVLSATAILLSVLDPWPAITLAIISRSLYGITFTVFYKLTKNK